MPSATAFVPTDRAARYVKQLVSHFSHRIDTELTDDGGRVTFGVGTCTLRSTDTGIVMDAVAESDEDLVQLEDVVARHLVRFGAKDELVVDWTPA
jgi:caffeoyl-CoA O-methyltransferase